MNLIEIYNSNGDKLSSDKLELFGLKLNIPSPSYQLITEPVDGRGGVIVLDRILQPRDISARFFTKSGSYEDSLKLRDELFYIFSSGNIYIAESNLPGKRWCVYSHEWSPDSLSRMIKEFEIPMTAPSGTSESVNVLNRTYSVFSFVFRNEGNHPIDMRTQEETEITFVGASSSLSILNNTTGDEWKYNGTTTANDVITLKGVRSMKNGQSIFSETNKRLISFAVGNNEFEISGVSGPFELSISTRFYFL
ncbi:phage tail domain-containing protein [Sporosarcina sp. OR05]|uniref:phage tail domain-containing protein n=1 Tax=Sporosarcina sp. OR05 TaxID=2969819 RepID=UPI00352A0F8F